MFAGLKNKIKEETGGDVGKLVDLVASVAPKIKGRHSRQGSSTSLSNFSIDGTKEDTTHVTDIRLTDGRVLTPRDVKKVESKEDEWRKKLQRKDDECRKKLEEKEMEMQKMLEKKELENSALLSEIRELHGSVKRLEDEVQQNAEYKAKVCQYQEDLDQLEGFQSQEMAKVKHLLLQKEQQLTENLATITAQHQRIADLTAEVKRLQNAEKTLADAQDRLETLRHESEAVKSSLTSRLAAEEETSRHLKDRLQVVEERYKAGCVALGGELTIDERVQGLLGERALYERLLTEAHEHLSEVKTSWSGKISSLETQVERLCRQASEESDERRSVERQRDEISARLVSCEADAAGLLATNRQLEEKLHNLLNNLNGDQVNEESKRIQEEELTNLRSRCSCLIAELDAEKESNAGLSRQLTDCQHTMEVDRRERDDLMIRNAQVSQEIELVKQELRVVKKESDDMQARMGKLQAAVREQDEMLGREKIEKDILIRRIEDLEAAPAIHSEGNKDDINEIKERNSQLENQMLDRNKTIRNLQQRISDMKKTMAKEQKVASRSHDPGGQNGGVGEGYIPPHGPALLTPMAHPPSPTLDPEDINFKYLKHVLFKFLTCREYEAQHLTRAVATLLRFNAEEERLLRETMDWRASWFGSKPRIHGNPFS